MLNNFIYAQEKSLFLEQLEAGNIIDEAIVFIEDTGEIWNHGTYFAGDCGFDPEVIREIQTAVANLKASKQDAISDLATIRIGASAGATAVQPETLNNYVPTNRTINGKSLTNNISLSASDVGAPAIGELNTTNTNVSDLTSKISSLTTDYSAFKQVFSDNSDEYINTWGEVKNFLDGIKNTEDLNNILLGINTQLGNKVDKSQLSGYLPLSGGTMQNLTGNMCPLYLLGNNTYVALGLSIGKNEPQAYLAFDGKELRYVKPDTSWNTLLHAGNIRDYAFTAQAQITNNTDADTLLTNGVYLNATGNGSGNSNFPSTYGILMTFTQDKNYSAQISVGNGSMHVRRKIDAWSDWKTVAFTDSDITGYAAGLKHSNGTVGAVLNSHGNVTIGASDLAGENNKLFVNGIQSIKSDISKGVAELNATAGNANVWNGNGNSHFTIANNNNRMSFFVGGIVNEKKASIQVGHINPAYGNAIGSLCLNPFGGSVGIGTANPLQKLHVAGNILLRNYDSIRFFKSDGTTQVESLTLNSDNEIVLGGDTNYYGLNTIVKGYRTIIKTGTYNTSALIIDENCNASIPYRLLVGGATDSGWIPFQVKGAADIDGPLYISAHSKEGIYFNENGIHWHNTSAEWVSALMEFSSDALLLHQHTTINGDLKVTGNIIADGQVSSTGRFRINTSNSVNSFGFLKATAYTDALNRSVMHIGSNYGGTSTLTSETMDVVAMSIYRGVLGIGKEYTYDELYANYNNAISLMVANNMSVNGSTYVNGNITTNSNIGIGTAAPTQKLDVRGNQYITGYIYADGDLHTGQWLKTSTGVAFGSAHTLTFNSYSIISNAELAFTNISTTDISTGIKAAIKAGMIQANDIIGHRIFLGNNSAGTVSNQAFSICKYGSVVDTAPSNITELLKVDPSGAVTINGSLSVTGNIISSDEYLGASNVLDNPEYASYPSSGSSMEMHSDIRNFVNNGTVVRKDGKLYVKDNPFAPVTTHWLDIFSDPTEIGGYNYSGPIELDLYPDRFYDFTNSLFISSIKINSIPGWDNPGLISHNIVRFRPTNTAFSLTLPSDIYWADGKPFEVDDNNAVYEMSFIVRNGGVITATWTKFTQA